MTASSSALQARGIGCTRPFSPVALIIFIALILLTVKRRRRKEYSFLLGQPVTNRGEKGIGVVPAWLFIADSFNEDFEV